MFIATKRICDHYVSGFYGFLSQLFREDWARAMPPIDAIWVSSRMFDVGCPEASKEPLDGNMIFYNEVRQERHLHYKVKMFFVEFFQ